jgi:hypothetical protein
MAKDIRKILADIGNEATQMLVKKLQDVDRVASQRLQQSIIALPIKVMGQTLILEIQMEDYWKFVDKGVDGTEVQHGSPYKFKRSGKRIPLGSYNKGGMLSHIANKGERYEPIVNDMIAKRKRKPLSRQKARESLAYALGVNIKKKGLKPTNFATDTFEKIESTSLEALSIALGKQIEIEIDKEVKNFKG